MIPYRLVLTLVREPGSDHWRYVAMGHADQISGTVTEPSDGAAALTACSEVHQILYAALPVTIALDVDPASPFWNHAQDVCRLLPGLKLTHPAPHDHRLLSAARARIGGPEKATAPQALSQVRPDPMGHLTVATDGSAKGRFTGYGWLASDGRFGLKGTRTDRRLVGREVASVAEIEAIADAIRHLPGCHVTILSDSRRAIRICEDWIAGSDAMPSGYVPLPGRRNRPSGLLASRDILRGAAPHVELEWVRGHAGHPLNEAADALARMACRSAAEHDLPGPELADRARRLTESFLHDYQRYRAGGLLQGSRS